MATRWFVTTSAGPDEVERAFHAVFFTRASLAERAKFWSKSAQLQSNLRWRKTQADDAVVAAALESGGLRELAQSSKYGGGSIIGTTIALALEQESGQTQGQLWLANYNTFIGINQQGDILRSYAKQIARELQSKGASARAHK